jgi:hypothetical protein
MKNIKNLIGGVILFVGFILILGAAGSDCDGKCMENAMSIGDILIYSFIGLGMMISGYLLLDISGEDY